MTDLFWLSLAVKLGATALIVVAACLVVERSGPVVGAMVATLPVSAGPAYAFLAMEHDAGFLAASALGSMAALGATAVFVSAYAAVAQRHGRFTSIAAALAAWLAFLVPAHWAGGSLAAAGALDAATLAACFFLVRRWRSAPLVARGRPSRWDIPIRALAAMGVVAAVLLIGRLLGPGVAGIAALAPVVMTSLGLLLHPRLGGRGAAAVLANTLPGIAGNILAIAALHLSAEALGSAPALLLSLAITLAWNAGAVALQRWLQARALAPGARRP